MNFGFSQNKKEQIAILSYSMDSLKSLLSDERKIFKAKIDEQDYLIQKLNDQVELQKAEIENQSAEINRTKGLLTQKTKEIDLLKLKIKELITIPEKYLIQSGSVGYFKIGHTIPASIDGFTISKKYRIEVYGDEEIREAYFVVYENGIEMLQIELAQITYSHKQTDKIGQIIILSEKFKTKEGIGLNSKLEDIIQVYNISKIVYSTNHWEKYGGDIEISNLANCFLSLDKGGFVGHFLDEGEGHMYAKISDFKPETLIKSITLAGGGNGKRN